MPMFDAAPEVFGVARAVAREHVVVQDQFVRRRREDARARAAEVWSWFCQKMLLAMYACSDAGAALLKASSRRC